MTKRILVTGASGFIASHCILDLLDHGYQVRGTLRDPGRANRLRSVLAKHTEHSDQVDFVQAELTDPDVWDAAMDGCDGVFHVASPVSVLDPEDPDELIIPAREGTLNVLRAARAAAIGRVVVTSSIAAVSGHREGNSRIQTADDWTDVKLPEHSPYTLSKTHAERAAWDFVADGEGPELATVNPALVLGPALEADYGSSLEAVLIPMSGAYPLVPRLGFSIVDVRDVAMLHRMVYEHPLAPGHRFIASNGFLWLAEIVEVLRREFPEFKRRLPKGQLPDLLTRLVARFDKLLASRVDDLGRTTEFDISVPKSIGWEPRSPEEAIIAAAKSLIELGLIKPK
jgi:dihydroflavonol-4-reductase